MLSLWLEKVLLKQVSPKFNEGVKKLVSVLAISIPVTETRKEAVEIAGATGASKNGKKSKSDYPENLAQVPCIRYPIIFRKKLVLMSVFFDSGSEVNAIHPIFV